MPDVDSRFYLSFHVHFRGLYIIITACVQCENAYSETFALQKSTTSSANVDLYFVEDFSEIVARASFCGLENLMDKKIRTFRRIFRLDLSRRRFFFVKYKFLRNLKHDDWIFWINL